MLIRIAAALATLLATTFSEQPMRPATATVARPRANVPAVDARALVLAFGDSLEELHDAVAYDADARSSARVARSCHAVLRQYPELRDAIGERGTDLLVAAESMVDACRRGFANTLDDFSFEVVDGDYYDYRERSFDFAQ